MNENLRGDFNLGWPCDTVLALMGTAGVGWWRGSVDMSVWPNPDSPPNSWDWHFTDSMVEVAATHGIKTLFCMPGVARWACTDTSIPRSLGWVWSNTPPRNLAAQVESGDSVARENWWAYFVYQAIMRYKPGGTFWTGSRAALSESFGIRYWEVWNEPNFMTSPAAGSGYRVGTSVEDSIWVVESLYARICDVSLQAARKADPEAGVLVGAVSGVEHEDLHPVSPATYHRLVKGKDWLRGYYSNRHDTLNFGITVHPYQTGDAGKALIPDTFARDLDTVRGIMLANGESDKALWATEFAYQAGPPDFAAQSVPCGHLAGLGGNPVKFYDRMFWASMAFDVGSSELLQHQGPSPGYYAQQPCYYAYQQMTQGLLGKRLNGRILSGDPVADAGMRVYELEDPVSGKKTWVGWRDYAPHAAGVAVRIPTRTDLLDIALLARRADADQSDFSVTARTDGWVGLTLGPTPVYVHETGTVTRPDLVVDSTWTSENPDHTVTFHARVKNIGNRELVSSGKLGSVLRFAIDGTPVDPVAEPKRLALGGIAVVRSAPVSPDRNVTHLVSATANPGKDVMELNFDNNAGYCPLSAR